MLYDLQFMLGSALGFDSEFAWRMLGSLFPWQCTSRRALSHQPKVAIIGAGVTGVAAACQCLDSGFEVTIFEGGSREHLGGIWTRVNDISALQTHSTAYKFHKRVRWQSSYPARSEILAEITRLWNEYGLESRTHFSTKILSISQDPKGFWIINECLGDQFDGIIVAIGTCSSPRTAMIRRQSRYKGQVFHSSELSGTNVKGRKCAIVGGGASAAEAIEFLVQNGAAAIQIVARSPKWIIPRPPIVGFLLALNIFNHVAFLTSVPETLLRKYFYRDLWKLAPTKKGIFTETPVCNSDLLNRIRSSDVTWSHGEVACFEEKGITYIPKDDSDHPLEQTSFVDADTVVVATGYHRPSLDFLPPNAISKPYNAPNWYLQTFPVGYPDICAINSTWVHGIGTVGGTHIGIYTRILIMFLADQRTRPNIEQMKVWVDRVHWWKSSGAAEPLEFVTWGELRFWFVMFLLGNPLRWGWFLFVLFGIGRALPEHSNLQRSGRRKRPINVEADQ